MRLIVGIVGIWFGALLLHPGAAWAQELPGEAHLVRGAEHFRSGDFSRALVEFKVAERVGAGPDALWYVAATLGKLGRMEEALEAFASAQQLAPEGRDAFLDYHHAILCFDSKLYLQADALLAPLAEQLGPKLSAQVVELRRRIEPLFREPPSKQTIDWYLERASMLRQANRPVLARLHLDEASRLSARREDRYGAKEAEHRSAAPGRSGDEP